MPYFPGASGKSGQTGPLVAKGLHRISGGDSGSFDFELSASFNEPLDTNSFVIVLCAKSSLGVLTSGTVRVAAANSFTASANTPVTRSATFSYLTPVGKTMTCTITANTMLAGEYVDVYVLVF